MNLAILFWFYKDLDLCRNRLRLLRRYNPDTRIFGLFGGNGDEADFFAAQLAPYLDDFYAFPDDKTAEWKWFNGDLMIAEWYQQRGRVLSWDSVFVAQWDMLVVGPVAKIFAELNEGEILLSDLRPVAEVKDIWLWTSREQEAERYAAFVEYMQSELGYTDAPLCCQFVVVVLPRRFLERYSMIAQPELGFIEYRVPTYARLFGVPFCQTKSFECWWPDEQVIKQVAYQDITLTGAKVPISFLTVCRNLARREGARVFHPFDRYFPLDVGSTRRLLGELVKAKLKPQRLWTSVARLSANVRRSLHQ